VSFCSRLNRLERDRPDWSRCRVCRDRPAHVMQRFRQDSLDAVPVPRPSIGDDGEPCTACGWAPVVTNITEVVVHSREDIARVSEREKVGIAS
jgi:hypothetical protein